jgi:3-hydroxybutyryl-CoA dehydratase
VSTLDWSASFEALTAGQSFRSRARTITEADIVGFSSLTGDFHPQHTDAEWAATSRFGERIAHGMLLVSYAVGLVPFDPSRVLALRRVSDVVFKRPACIGTTIHVTGQVAALRRIGEDAGLVALHWDIRDGSDALLCRAQVEVLWATNVPASSSERRHASEILDLPAGVIPC